MKKVIIGLMAVVSLGVVTGVTPVANDLIGAETVEAAKAKPLLAYGSMGNDVKIVQRIVGVKVDGVFGKDTYNAVWYYQYGRGLKADGIVGKATWRAMGYK
ncbi:peptidoglycan-binding domain-containing protein [Enterococcus sp. AZ196]|uniref:peptidoglycan-binding domain-containing protein n=1 Tax=Enterococcus sp. AZ196 TaxID=2774659 RepID=UPI003D2973DA